MMCSAPCFFYLTVVGLTLTLYLMSIGLTLTLYLTSIGLTLTLPQQNIVYYDYYWLIQSKYFQLKISMKVSGKNHFSLLIRTLLWCLFGN